MPLGRDIHSAKPFVPPSLDDDALAHMRAPPDVDEVGNDDESNSDEGQNDRGGLPGAFPGSSSTALTDDSYY